MTEHAHVPLRKRTVGTLRPEGGDALILVDHMYAPEGAFRCGHCGEAGHDPGFVSLFVDEDPDDDEADATVVSLTPAEALVLAERLTRAASLVLESGEDRPDVEREAARFAVPDDASEAEDPEETAFRHAKQVFKDVWDAWNDIPEGHPSPIKQIARNLGMSAGDVAAIVFPPEESGGWTDAQEPDLPEDDADA